MLGYAAERLDSKLRIDRVKISTMKSPPSTLEARAQNAQVLQKGSPAAFLIRVRCAWLHAGRDPRECLVSRTGHRQVRTPRVAESYGRCAIDTMVTTVAPPAVR